MGQRANLIIIDKGEYKLYYDHWAANRLDSYLFWGAKKAIAFFRNHEKQGDKWWLDTIWCEGGAVIDLKKKVLLWFGGEEILYNIPLKRLLLELMQKNWKGFDVRWAYEGVADLADFVGHDRRTVIAPFIEKDLFDKERIQRVFNRAEADPYWDCAVSIRNEDHSIELFTVNISAYLQEFLYFGSGLINYRHDAKPLAEYCDDVDSENTLLAGINIDIPNKGLDIWSSNSDIFDYPRLESVWEGYRIHYHRDRFEVQTELTDGRLIFTEQSRSELLSKVKQIVCRDNKDPLNTVNSLISRLSEQEKEVKVTPTAFMASRFKSSRKYREKLFCRRFER